MQNSKLLIKPFFHLHVYLISHSFIILEIKIGNKMHRLKYYKTYYISNPSIPPKSIKSATKIHYTAMLERYFSQILTFLLEFWEASWNLYFSIWAKLLSHFLSVRNIHVKHLFWKDPLENNHILLTFLY